LLVLEVILVLLTFFFGASILWSTLFLGISPMPSSKKARQAMIQLSHETGQGPIFELGSGWGNLLIPMALKHPQRKIVGYELSLLPWLTTAVLKRLFRLDNLQVFRKNFLHADLSSASLIVCYLCPNGMHDIETQLASKDGNLEYLISNNFALPSHQAVAKIQLTDFYKSPVYLYKFKYA
jgi:16S rRNA A1518/A1519 N6-dimethyltransferase RsmA/KsgA/DIM1 with predicted DNA glycosylase/AP lyase activity